MVVCCPMGKRDFGSSLKAVLRSFCLTLWKLEKEGDTVTLVSQNIQCWRYHSFWELARSQQEALHNRESIASLKISVSMLCLDTLPLLRKVFPDVENHSLSMIYAHLFQGEFGRRSHCCSRQQRSIQNAFTTLQLFVILNNNLYFKEWEF